MSFRICHLGKKNIKMESGETIEIPNFIRLMIPSRVVEQYNTFCKEQEFEPLSKRTLLHARPQKENVFRVSTIRLPMVEKPLMNF